MDVLGVGPTCAWSSPTTVEVLFGAGATLVPTSPSRRRRRLLVEHPEQHRRLAACSPQSSLQPVQVGIVPPAVACIGVSPPVSAIPVNAILAAPQHVGVCDSLVVDASQSTGSAGREMTCVVAIICVHACRCASCVLLASVPLLSVGLADLCGVMYPRTCGYVIDFVWCCSYQWRIVSSMALVGNMNHSSGTDLVAAGELVQALSLVSTSGTRARLEFQADWLPQASVTVFECVVCDASCCTQWIMGGHEQWVWGASVSIVTNMESTEQRSPTFCRRLRPSM